MTGWPTLKAEEFKGQSSELLDPRCGGAAGKAHFAAANRNIQATEATDDNPALPDGPIPDSGVPGRVPPVAAGRRLTEREQQEEETLP